MCNIVSYVGFNIMWWGVVNAMAAENQANVILASGICICVLTFRDSDDLCFGLEGPVLIMRLTACPSPQRMNFSSSFTEARIKLLLQPQIKLNSNEHIATPLSCLASV